MAEVSRLKVKVVPGATHPGIAGWLGDRLKIRVAAQPERGKANAAVEAILCEALSLSRSGARIVSGNHSREKIVEICGVSETELYQRLGKPVV